ncbi:MAG: glycoside hydrolase family 25 protein [Lachnospiraceae bacterium]
MHNLEDDNELIDLDTDENADFPDMPYDPFEDKKQENPPVESDSGEGTTKKESTREDTADTLAIEEFVQKNSKAPGLRSRKRKNRSTGSVLTWILALTTVCSVGLCIYMLINPRTEPVSSDNVDGPEEEPAILYSQEEVDLLMARAADEREQTLKNEIRNQLEVPEPSLAETLRWLYSDSILYLDENGYHFVPISETIEKHQINCSNFSVSENGVITYTEQGKPRALMGIDVSQHQGEIDWEQVASSDVEFAIIRAGIRGYETGALVTDSYFETNMQGALDNGIEVGVYFFTQAVSEEEAVEEAQYVLELIAPYQISYPVVIDVENPAGNARANVLTQAERTAVIRTFCDTIAAAGYTPMIYGNTHSLFGMLDIEQIQQYEIWHAFYNNYVYYPYRLKMWQYTASGQVPGISGTVDLNLWFLD